jgi:hypothetical protein
MENVLFESNFGKNQIFEGNKIKSELKKEEQM